MSSTELFNELNEECLLEDKQKQCNDTMDVPYKGKTLKQHLANKSNCCCGTGCICHLHHEKYISEQS